MDITINSSQIFHQLTPHIMFNPALNPQKDYTVQQDSNPSSNELIPTLESIYPSSFSE